MSTFDAHAANPPSNPTLNGTNTLEDGIASIRKFLSQNDKDDSAADLDITSLLRQLEQADGIGRDVEGRIDAVLEQLDGILGSFGEDGKVLEAEDGQAASQDGKAEEAT
ncbi:hypothetical protein OF83DRAFT_1072213 [Amylostereum chailletii]|nr:hypothetical protein OF83DRAFT_1072213 [Amylostereum chailletii]